MFVAERVERMSVCVCGMECEVSVKSKAKVGNV